jgi:hypothetical protein
MPPQRHDPFQLLHLHPAPGKLEPARPELRHRPGNQGTRPLRCPAQRQAVGAALQVAEEPAHRSAPLPGRLEVGAVAAAFSGLDEKQRNEWLAKFELD